LKALSSADPDRELAGRRPCRAAAHGRVQHVRTLLGEGSVELLHDARRIGRQVEIGGAGLDAGNEPIWPERDRLHIARLRQRGEDDVGLPCEGSRAVCPDGTVGKMMAGRLPVQVVDDQPEAGSLHVGGHAAAHGAQPDEPHRHVVLGHAFTVAAIRFSDRQGRG